ncbi:MAG TPA: glycosyltransferase family 4 protein [Bdellovibrio sp.]|nr:glycosyltransferase family 4 protein [Bdellovibrio sp.]
MGEIKVLHCIHSLSWGGLEIYTSELIQKLQETGTPQLVFCAAQGRVTEELKKANVRIITFPEKKLSKFSAARRIRRIIREHNITVLHSHTRLDMWACALARWNNRKIKHIYNLYMNAIPKKDFIHKWLFSKVDALCSSSETILADVKTNFPISFKKLHLIRYGRNTERFVSNPRQREELRNLLGTQPQQIVIGTLCRIDPGKGIKELVEALESLSTEELERIQLWIIGDPTIKGQDENGQSLYADESKELLQWLKEQCSQSRYKNNLIYLPFQKDYIPYIDALDIFALASYNETYSLSVLDAMMMGKPVIGTSAGGTLEQVGKDERGLLVTPQSANSLAGAFRYYFHHPDVIQRQGQLAQKWSLENHRWPETLKKFLELYKQLTQS